MQRPVDQPMPGAAGVRQPHGDLGVLDPPGGAGVVPLPPDRGGALLQITGLVHHQDRVRVGELLNDVAADVVADRVGVPDRPGQQMLHAVRAGLASVFGDRPAVLPRQLSQQPDHERPDPPPRLHPSEPRRHPAHQLFEHHLPPDGVHGLVYAPVRAHRRTVWSRHNP